MKCCLILFALSICFGSLLCQDSIRYRVILIGDAGEIDPKQQAVIPAAAAKILANRTTVLYLGDNIYPRGMSLPGTSGEQHTQDILKAQYEPMRRGGAPVFFIPGNHDWDKMGPKGLRKITAQSDFIAAQKDSLLRMAPSGGCPDPVEINLSDSLTVIAFDSEWWLFPYNKANPECSCQTKEDVVIKMQDIFFRNRYKMILLASHHPFQSYGTHGGYFSLKDNLFPLTAASENLYVPLPVVGSLYPVLRRLFTNPEDVRHPLYQDMVNEIDAVFKGFPNMVHVAGHEHGLQFIKDEQVQVVSGAGAKGNFVKEGRHSLYAKTIPGFVTADLLTDQRIRFTYYTYDHQQWTTPFSYAMPIQNIRAKEEASYKIIRTDSVLERAHPAFDRKRHLYRIFFGENYRKEWAAPTMLPVIRVSEIHGGLTPISRGGGKQTHSLRLEDSAGKEWVLRSVEKFPDVVLPEPVRKTFLADVVTDAMSAQHPYSALIVPPLANAAHVPHANPIIGWVSPDKKLGAYSTIFENTICLLEEREPIGKSENTVKMVNDLRADNDNRVDQEAFLNAKLLDMLLADWDRHWDQWRWYTTGKKNKEFTPVPRDRDQVIRISTGIFPRLASSPWIAPFLQGFGPRVKNPAALFYSSTELSHGFLNSISYRRWMDITNQFMARITDSVLERGLDRLPSSSKKLRYARLLADFESRRNDLRRAMDVYYRFLNKKPQITLSDKNEFVSIRDSGDKNLQVDIYKISKTGETKELLFSKTYTPDITKEIRIFLAKGNDSIHIDDPSSPIKLRIVGGEGTKRYEVAGSRKRINIYDKPTDNYFSGSTGRFSKHLSADTSITTIDPGVFFDKTTPLLVAGYNIDDGFLLGAGVRLTRQGFRKHPFGSEQELSLSHSFTTTAFRIKYDGAWLHVLNKADFTLSANIAAPDNTQNFYGTGNESEFVKSPGYAKFYRARFDLLTLQPAIRWRNQHKGSVSIGPVFQYYSYDSSDNAGRFIGQGKDIHSFDSSTIDRQKLNGGLFVEYINDQRSSELLPAYGYFLHLKLTGMAGLSHYASSFGQISGDISVYKPLTRSGNLVLSDRIGGSAIAGHPAFYQSAYLGGQGNLLGYRQFRFAGQQMVYNNLEVRLKLADFASYIVPGQFGMVALFDIGRVWEVNDHSSQWHNGFGGGFYFSPAQMAIVRIVAAHSVEGFYPYITIGLRF